MWKVRNKTLDDLLNYYIKDPALKDVLAFNWSYYGLPPSMLSGFYYAAGLGDYFMNGSYYVRSRSQDLSNALVKAIEASGGKIFMELRQKKF